jgi:cell division septation protein DedD
MRTLFVAAVLPVALSVAQTTDPDIASYLARVERGESGQVALEVPALLSRYPNHPGVLYVQGVTTSNGPDAVRIYQSIVDNFPRSEWADDALYKVYQFYHSLGLYRTAELKLAQLRKEYPDSRHGTDASGIDAKGLADAEPPSLAPPPEPQPGQLPEIVTPSPVPPPPPASAYALQVGAFAQISNAEKQKTFFEDLGFPVEVIQKVRDTRSLFVVLVGNYKDADEARAKVPEFKARYSITPMVVTR